MKVALATSTIGVRALTGLGAFLFLLVMLIAGMGAALVQPSAAACTPDAQPSGKVKGVPAKWIPHYKGAAVRFDLGPRGPSILAGIHRIETNFGTLDAPGVSSGENFAGAGGPMQFLGPTWDAYGVDGDKDGDRDRYDGVDAIYAAANYLNASGAPGDWQKAIFAYNHAQWYVDDVLGYASDFGDLGPVVEATCEEGASGPAELSEAVRLTSPRAYKTLPAKFSAPGYGAMEIDARLYDNAVWLLNEYDLRLTAAREGGHASHGNGQALDIVPAGDLGSQAVWDRSAGRTAFDLGWTRGCAASGVPPTCKLVPSMRFIGYDGYPSHGSPRTCGGGCPAHLHISWASSGAAGAPAPPADWVMAFPSPGGS